MQLLQAAYLVVTTLIDSVAATHGPPDHGATWAGGALLPEAGEHGLNPGPPNQTNGALGGWTECQVRAANWKLSGTEEMIQPCLVCMQVISLAALCHRHRFVSFLALAVLAALALHAPLVLDGVLQDGD